MSRIIELLAQTLTPEELGALADLRGGRSQSPIVIRNAANIVELRAAEYLPEQMGGQLCLTTFGGRVLFHRLAMENINSTTRSAA